MNFDKIKEIPLVRLWTHLAPRRHRQFVLLLIMIVVTSFTEVLSIGAILPFLAVLTAPEKVLSLQEIRPFIEYWNFKTPNELLFPLTMIFAGAAILAGAMRLILLWLTTKLSFATGADLSMEIYKKTLNQPYSVHVSRNSSEIVTGIVSKANSVSGGIIQQVLILLSSAFVLITILLGSVAINPSLAISTSLIFGLLYSSVAYAFKRKLLANGKVIADEQTIVMKSLQEGLGGIRDVLIDGTQDVYCEAYRKSDRRFRVAQGNNAFMSGSPRYTIEALAMVLMAFFAYSLTFSEGGFSTVIPTLGTLALGAQRMLPALQQGFQSWANLQSTEAILVDVLKLLDQKLPDTYKYENSAPLRFQSEIRGSDLYFQYNSEGPSVLKGLDFAIKKGTRIGFVGTTGSGKSTLLDIVMGLLEPTSGELTVDGQTIRFDTVRAWQKNIAHVPQSIYLSDSSILENIAFGTPPEKIDRQKAVRAAQQAQISSHIESLKEGYETIVGERGVRLSGGQRQRIGIARALYKEASVIVFDEATSALDNETEKAVMDAIEGLGKELTIIMIAHRISTVSKCDNIYEMKDGRIVKEGRYSELFARKV
ncbi:ABC transporter ATP-binding protein [Leptospira fluminis]|uniref:Multidrug resistance-like ATP-binding protein MdlB n=1 Tax=Leptospira fluminis TaxID=2484979 RepID=A0A4R9GNV6_9LEPT|nr:ABC transporter ATP-binding protein [Leptospira fluminis]TGK17253.1 ABC transporter ATP-binding protein [Leptospira fluminis]